MLNTKTITMITLLAALTTAACGPDENNQTTQNNTWTEENSSTGNNQTTANNQQTNNQSMQNNQSTQNNQQTGNNTQTESKNALEVSDQTRPGDDAGRVLISSVTSDTAGFVVIHTDNDGAPGPVIGHAAVSQGPSEDVWVQLDRDAEDGERLHAMLHVDDPADGEYTFGDDSSQDVPARGADGQVVVSGFTVTIEDTQAITPLVMVSDQQVTADAPKAITIERVVAPADGYIVIHEQDADGNLVVEPAVGVASVQAGENIDVTITLERWAVDGETLYAMLHTEGGGDASAYDSPGEDPPVKDAEGAVIAPAFTVTAPTNSVTAPDQTLELVSTQVTIESTYALDAGYIVIHEGDGAGGIGGAIGWAPANRGVNGPIEVALARPAADGETLYAMLHVEGGGDPDTYDDPSTDPPARDTAGEVVTPAFSVTVPAQTPAVIFEVNANGASDYTFSSAIPARFDAWIEGGPGANDPTLSLRQGWRYKFDLGATAGPHPIEFGAEGDYKLVQGSGGDEATEQDAEIGWVDEDNAVTFTLTPALGAALSKYRCVVHAGMTGDIVVTTP